MWDLHLHQRFWYDGYDVVIAYDGMGEGGRVKTVQWWTDVFWAGQAEWWDYVDYGADAWGYTEAFFESGQFAYARVWQQCHVYADGSGWAYAQWEYTQFPGWHVHFRGYGGFPPDW